MRIAAIDIGTNSIHMIVVQVRPDLSFEVIDREKEMVRLGAGGLDGRSADADGDGRGAPDALQVPAAGRVAPGRRDPRRRHQRRRARPTNGGDFLAAVDARRRASASASSPGTEEARLIHLAAVYGVDVGAHDRGRHRHRRRQRRDHARHGRPTLTLGKSFKLGVIRLTERFVKSDPLVGRDERRLVKHHRPRDRSATSTRSPAAASTASSARRARSSASARWPRPTARARRPTMLRNLRVSAKALHRAAQAARRSRPRRAAATPGPRSAPRRPRRRRARCCSTRSSGGSAPTSFTLCDLALREGLVLDYIHRNSARIRKVERYPDVRRRSVVELGERCGYWSEHAQQVARLALAHLRPDAQRPRPRPTASASGSSTPRCCTTSASTSATSAITGTRTT